MKRFYVLLAAVVLIGGGVIWYGSRSTSAAPAASQPTPVAASDGFRGFTLGSEAAPGGVTEYSDFECPFWASFATVQMPGIRQQPIPTGKGGWRHRDFPLPTHPYLR